MKNKEHIEKCLRQKFDSSLPEMIERYLFLDWATVSQVEYFTDITKECYDLYVHGYYMSAIMVSQSINEAFARYWIVRNKHIAKENEAKEDSVNILVENNILPSTWRDAFSRISKSFRNDYHHVNSAIKKHPHEELAKRNLKDLAFLESEMFQYSLNDGKIVPTHPQYWEIKQNGLIDAYVNFE